MPRASKSGIRGLSKLADGSYRLDLRWKDPKTGAPRRHVERFAPGLPFPALKKRAQEVLAGVVTGQGPAVIAPMEPTTLAAALCRYESWAETNRPQTLETRKSLIRVLNAGFGPVRLDQLSPFGVEKFKKRRADEGAQPGTINRAVGMLKHALAMFVEWELMPPEQADAIRKVRLLKEPAGRVRYLTADEETRLFAELSKFPRQRGVCRIVAATVLSGLRMGEMVNLRKTQVDLVGRVIVLTKTKNGKVRSIPICDALAPIFETAMKESDIDLVFASHFGKGLRKGDLARPYTKRGLHSVFFRAVKRAKIQDLRFHDLRHHFATELRRRGTGLDVIARLLGHSTMQMSSRYAHLVDATLREAVAQLPAPAIPTGPVATALPPAQPVSASK